MGFTAVKNTVCLSLPEFCPPRTDRTSNMINVLEEIVRNHVLKDQWGCVLNDLEEFKGKEFLVLMDQYNIEIFSCCLRLLPPCSSIHHQTNIESTQIYSEDHLSVSRIRSPHLLLEVILSVEEECLFFLPLGTLDQIELLVQYQSIFFQE